MNIKPLYDRLLIEPLSDEERGKKTSSGIIIPDTAGEKPQEGKVVAVGEGRLTEEGKTLPMKVKVGDKVIYAKYNPSEIKVGDKEYLIAKEDDILAIIG